jgi:hypothetical protein
LQSSFLLLTTLPPAPARASIQEDFGSGSKGRSVTAEYYVRLRVYTKSVRDRATARSR